MSDLTSTIDIALRRRAVRVLIVDDSALVRRVLSDILNGDPDIEVVGCAADPFKAAKVLRTTEVDVITLDIEMPRMDGLTFLKKLMSQKPRPVVMCSTLTKAHAEPTIRALELGAVDIITKPELGTKRFLEEASIRICDAVKAAARVRVTAPKTTVRPVESKLTADVILPAPTKVMSKPTERIVVVGASTGGTEALRVLLGQLPIDCPGTVVVQHMPEKFTKAFANRLNDDCSAHVKEACDGDPVRPGQVLIAPGNRHVLIARTGSRYRVDVRDGPLVCRHRPSVDVLFRSAAQYAGRNAVGVLLTGMGDDGARGMLELKEAGAWTIAQDKASCVVFGMPKEAIKRDAARAVLPLGEIAPAVLKHRPGP